MSGSDPCITYSAAAAQLGLTEGAVRVAVHRTRKEFAQAIRKEIAETLSDPAQIDAELRELMTALASRD